MKIRGTLSKYIYTNDSGWAVAIFRSSESKLKNITITGMLSGLLAKQTYELEGEFETNTRYGKSFKVFSFVVVELNSSKDVIDYFSSSLFPGVGIKTAQKIYDTYGTKAREILKQEPKKIYDLNDISKDNADTIFKIISKNSTREKITDVFIKENLSSKILANLSAKITDDEELLSILQNNFYKFYLVSNLNNFFEIDKIAIAFGAELCGAERVSAWALYFTNSHLFKTGDTFITYSKLLKELDKKFNLGKELDNKLLYAKENNFLVFKNKKIYTYESYNDEIIISSKLNSFIGYENKISNDDFKKYISEIESEISIEKNIQNFSYSENQKEVLLNFIKNKFSVVTGGPGTGKTTVILGIIKLFKKFFNSDDIALAAPTGRAASRLSEVTNFQAQTIHKLLNFWDLEKATFNSSNPLNYELLIIDEASMIDNILFSKLVSALGNVVKFVIVGDIQQLPSINYGNVLQDIIESKKFATTFLTKIFRQSSTNGIILLASQISDNITNFLDFEKLNNVNFIFENNIDNYLNLISESFKKYDSDKSINDLQIISPMYNGDAGIKEINNLIQKSFNVNSINDEKYFMHSNNKYFIDDKIMYLKNDSDLGLSNGDIGIIKELDISKNGKLIESKVLFNDKMVVLRQSNFNDVTLSYACSVHKTQGSEFENVILVLDPIFYPIFLNKKLIYTAVTRAKNNLTIITSKDVFLKAVDREPPKRNTTLIEMLNLS